MGSPCVKYKVELWYSRRRLLRSPIFVGYQPRQRPDRDKAATMAWWRPPRTEYMPAAEMEGDQPAGGDPHNLELGFRAPTHPKIALHRRSRLTYFARLRLPTTVGWRGAGLGGTTLTSPCHPESDAGPSPCFLPFAWPPKFCMLLDIVSANFSSSVIFANCENEIMTQCSVDPSSEAWLSLALSL